MEPSPDFVIVGGGVIGCGIAHRLASEGASVTVIERSRVAAESSGAAAGILAPPVLNGASDLLVEVFGDNGRHARLALGAAELNDDIPVETEMIVQVRPPTTSYGDEE